MYLSATLNRSTHIPAGNGNFSHYFYFEKGCELYLELPAGRACWGPTRRPESGTSEVGAEGWGALPLSSRHLQMTCWSKTWRGIQKTVKRRNDTGLENVCGCHLGLVFILACRSRLWGGSVGGNGGIHVRGVPAFGFGWLDLDELVKLQLRNVTESITDVNDDLDVPKEVKWLCLTKCDYGVPSELFVRACIYFHNKKRASPGLWSFSSDVTTLFITSVTRM